MNTQDWSNWLIEVLDRLHCPTGTLHQVSAETGLLRLLAQRGIPPFLLDKIDNIPMGKGIAGCAAQRNEPVQMCNLQQDQSGVARPDAAQTKVEGALAVPIFHPTSGDTIGVLGIGKLQPYEFTVAEIAELSDCAAQAAQNLSFS